MNRISLGFGSRAEESLNELKKALDMSSNFDVIVFGLKLLKFIHYQDKLGLSLGFRSADGVFNQINIFEDI